MVRLENGDLFAELIDLRLQRGALARCRITLRAQACDLLFEPADLFLCRFKFSLCGVAVVLGAAQIASRGLHLVAQVRYRRFPLGDCRIQLSVCFLELRIRCREIRAGRLELCGH